MVTEFGKKLEFLQTERGLSSDDLANKAHIKRQRIWQLKHTVKPQPTTIYKLARALEVPVSFFLDS